MAQEIKQGNIFGRIGSNIGKGLAEQLPEEIQRGRLSSGLKKFETEHQDLNPMQQLARISAIPGATPQMIQSFTELAKINNKRNAYGRGQGGSGLNQTNEANIIDQAANAGMPMQSGFNPTGGQGRQLAIGTNGHERNAPSDNSAELTHPNPSSPGQSQLTNYNLGDPNAITKLPWTPRQRDNRVVQYMDQGFLPEEAKELASNDEARDLAVAPAVQQQQKEKKARAQEAENILDKQLETRLQKNGEGVYNDISGDMLADLRRAMSKTVVENPNASAEDIAEVFSKRALELATAKKEVEGLAAKTGIEEIFQGDKVLNKLRSNQKIFQKAGNQREYFNILREKFHLSDQGAALVAYPPMPQTKKYLDFYKSPVKITSSLYKNLNPEKFADFSKKAALDISKIMDENDSPLAIARILSEKDPYFDQRAFFEELTQNPDIRLNSRQRTEASALGEKDLLPTWGDIKIFPWLGRSKK